MLKTIVNKEYFVYIVRCSDDSLYTGYTTDINRRISEHNSVDKGAKYTKQRRPVQLVYKEIFATESDAKKREYQIKAMTRSQKLRLVADSMIH